MAWQWKARKPFSFALHDSSVSVLRENKKKSIKFQDADDAVEAHENCLRTKESETWQGNDFGLKRDVLKVERQIANEGERENELDYDEGHLCSLLSSRLAHCLVFRSCAECFLHRWLDSWFIAKHNKIPSLSLALLNSLFFSFCTTVVAAMDCARSQNIKKFQEIGGEYLCLKNDTFYQLFFVSVCVM